MPLLPELRIAVMATDGFEALELLEPLRALRAEGCQADVIAPHAGQIQGMHGLSKTVLLPVDRALSEIVRTEQYDALLLPGGALSADTLRVHSGILRFVAGMHDEEKPIAALSQAVRILISAGVVQGRRIAGLPPLRDDLVNAQAIWQDIPVLLDENLLTARGVQDLAEFDVAMMELFSRRPTLISPQTRHLLSRSRIA